ncbi:MAG TPA: hypothetical protein VJQ55_02765 [Candidatus Binatia bacterium]|nr:hypothetical protein [Candidatus Binatia bacterium]
MQGDHTYAFLLRPIGQMLENLRIESFAVRPDGDGFVVRDQTRRRAQLTPRERAFLAELHRAHTGHLDKEDALRLAAGVLEWHVTATDLERFEYEGRGQRRGGGRAPDMHSVSQLLRVIGAIVDQKHGYLCSISKDEQSVTLEYDLPNGKMATEEYDIPTLYDCWVRMYKRRTPTNGEPHLTA